MALTKASLVDLNANELILDLDADTSIRANTDDTIDFKIAGSTEVKITATGLAPGASDGNALGTTALEWSDLYLADGAVVSLGNDQDVTLTHVADTGLLLNSTRQLQFGDSGTYIHQSADGVLDLVSDTEIEINATTIDVNGNLDVSGTIVGAGALTAATSITVGSAVLTEAELETLDGITAGTVIASKAIVTDANIDITGGRNITISGELDAATGDFSGDVDIDGTANLDVVDIDGATQIDAIVTVGVNDTGYDVKFFGATSGAYMLWDESADDLILAGAGRVVVPDGQLVLGSTAVTSTAAELNLIDGGASAGTTAVADADGILTNDGGTMRLTTAATFKTYFQEGISTAYDDFTIGDAAVLITTSAGNITIDAAGNDTDIILKGTDGTVDTTYLTIDGSAAGEATFNAGIVIADAGNIGSASDKDAIAIASNGVVTFSQIPVMPANSIDSDEYIDGSIDREHLAADIIDGTKIADDAIDSEHYTDGSIDTAHIADGQVTFAKTTGLVGKQSIWVPAAAMTPTVSNGCAALVSIETTAGRPDMNVLDFDKDSDEFAQFSVAFPKSWNAGTITFQFFWSGIAATTGVAMNLQGVSFADNDSIDTAYGTAVVVQDDAQGAVEELLVSAESGAVTIAGSPGDNELCYFRVGRDISDGNDDMAGDCRLHGIKLFYTTDALTDA